MEEKKQKRYVRDRIDRGIYFNDIDGFSERESNMIADYWNYAMTYFNSYRRQYPHIPEDVVHDAIVDALIYCVKTWDCNKPSSFKTWFHKGCIISMHKHHRRFLIAESKKMSENVSVLDGDKTLGDTLYNEDSKFEDKVIDEIYVNSIFDRLTPTQAEYAKRVYIDLEKQSDVARDNGVTRQSVEQALRHAKTNIKNILSGGDYHPYKRGVKDGTVAI